MVWCNAAVYGIAYEEYGMSINEAVSILERMLKCVNTKDGCVEKECSECEFCVTPEVMREPLESAILSLKAWDVFIKTIGEEALEKMLKETE